MARRKPLPARVIILLVAVPIAFLAVGGTAVVLVYRWVAHDRPTGSAVTTAEPVIAQAPVPAAEAPEPEPTGFRSAKQAVMALAKIDKACSGRISFAAYEQLVGDARPAVKDAYSALPSDRRGLAVDLFAAMERYEAALTSWRKAGGEWLGQWDEKMIRNEWERANVYVSRAANRLVEWTTQN